MMLQLMTLFASPIVRYLSIGAAILFAVFIIRAHAINGERERWEAERARQEQVDRTATADGQRRVDELKKTITRLEELLRKNDDEARKAPDADHPALGPDSLRRLDEIR